MTLFRPHRSRSLLAAAAVAAAVVFSTASPGLAAGGIDVSSPHVALGDAGVDLSNLAPGDADVEPISLQNTGSVPMRLELVAGTPTDTCLVPACVVGTDTASLAFSVVDASGTVVWSGSLPDLESGVTLSQVVAPGATANLTLTISLPLGTPDGGQGERLNFALSGTGVPIGPTQTVLPPLVPAAGSGSGAGTGPGNGNGPTVVQTASSGASALTIGESADPAVVPAEGRVGFAVTLANDGSSKVDGISLRDQLPATDALGWSLLQPGPGSQLSPAEGCALVGSTLTCSGLSVLAGASLSVQVQSTPVALDCTQSTVSNSVSVSEPGQPVASRSASAMLTCVLGELISGSPSRVQAAKAPIRLSGALPFTGSRFARILALIALALILVGAVLALSGKVSAQLKPNLKKGSSSSLG